MTIRELLKLVAHALTQFKQLGPDVFAQQQAELLSRAAHAVYAARFRTTQARNAIAAALPSRPKAANSSSTGSSASTSSMGSSTASSSVEWDLEHAGNTHTLTINGVRLERHAAQDAASYRRTLSTDPVASRLPAELQAYAVRTHTAIANHILSKDFAEAHGLYSCSPTQLLQWCCAAVEASQFGWAPFAAIGAQIYAAPQRHSSARESIRQLFQPLPDGSWVGDPRGLFEKIKPTAAGTKHTERPIAVTPQTLKLWGAAAFALESNDPIQISGEPSEACSKYYELE